MLTHRKVFRILAAFTLFSLLSAYSSAQSYLGAVGNPSFSVNLPIPNGYINIANGNLHLEVPLSRAKQRGALQLDEKLIYDSRIWKIVNYSGYYWWPLNVPNSQAGWRLVKGNETGTISSTVTGGSNYSCWTGNYYQPYNSYTTYYSWTDPAGTVHPFTANSTATYYPSNCPSVPSGTVYSSSGGAAVDASGYSANVTNDAQGNVSITVRDNNGAQVYPQVIDRYGNYWSTDGSSNLIDDRGLTPVITTQNDNLTYYDVLAPNGPISNNGTRVRYTVTTEQVTLSTSFGQSGVTEYQNNGSHPTTITAIQSIGLPDGSSYQFAYDSYAMITSMTLPTGGVVGFGWTNYTDSYQNVNRWLSSSTIANATTSYTPSVVTQCSGNGTGCVEQVNVHRPSGDETVYKQTLNNGAWNTNETIYQGAASSNQAKVQTTNTYDFSQPCVAYICQGAQNVTKSTETDTLVDANLSTQTQTTYNTTIGKMTSLGRWDYFQAGSTPSATPTRQTTYQYNGLDLSSKSTLDSSGNTISTTTYNYGGAAAGTSGLAGRGSANAGGPFLNSITTTNNAPAGSITQSFGYEDTGQLISTTDANNNPVTSFHYDPTHTFITEVDKPDTPTSGYHHVSRSTYDPYSGAVLSTCDENCVATNLAYTAQYSYEATAGRLQTIRYADGGSQSYGYPNANEIDKTVQQTSSVSVTTSNVLDGYGRPQQTSSSGITSTQGYDGNGRPFSVTAPAGPSSSPTDGTTTTSYDALDRVTQIMHPDGTHSDSQVVGNVSTTYDELHQPTSRTFNAFGELVSVTEADPSSGNLSFVTNYTRDALGNVTCIEQHGSASGAGCSSSPSSDASSPWRIRRFFYNALSQLKAASIPEHTSPSSPPSQNCGVGGGPWTDCYSYDSNGNQTSVTNNAGVTQAYLYDVLNRPIRKSPTQDMYSYYGYDYTANSVGRFSYQTNEQNAANIYAYDVMGRLASEGSCRPSTCSSGSYPAVQVSYDLAGNVSTITYPDGRVVTDAYDSLNRLSTVTYSSFGGTAVGKRYWTANSYAPPGELLQADYGDLTSGSNPAVRMQAFYNNRQSITSLSYQSRNTANPATLFNKSYKWDSNASNLLWEINQLNGHTRQYSYDKLNRLTSAVDVSGSPANSTGTATVGGAEGSSSECGDQGNTNTATQDAGSTAQPAVQPQPCTTTWDTGTISLTVGSFTATANYGKLSTPAKLATTLANQLNTSNIVTATVSGAVITMTSIATGAVANYSMSETDGDDFYITLSGTAMTGGASSTPVSGGMNQQYTLDAWGNLSSMSSGYSTSITGQNQVTGSGVSYDAAGRLLSDGVQSFGYNDDGMMTSSGYGPSSYVYDADLARARTNNGSGSTEYWYFGGQLMATYNPANGQWTDMIYAGGQRIATVAGNLSALPVYVLPDQLGSESASADGNANANTYADYGPYGQLLSAPRRTAFSTRAWSGTARGWIMRSTGSTPP